MGKRIHELRAAKKWSQEEFAHVSGLHRTYIGQIERGEKNISFDNLSRVASALGVNLAGLLEGLENGSTANVKLPQVETGARRDAAHLQIEARKLVRRFKLQHAEMDRTILALESLAANYGRPKSSRRRSPKTVLTALETLTGFRAYRGQYRLFLDFLEGRIPDALDVPTGLGKTFVIGLWLAARALG